MTPRLFAILLVPAFCTACVPLLVRLLDDDIYCDTLPSRYFVSDEFHSEWNFAGAWLDEMDEPRIRSTWLSGTRVVRITFLPHDFAPLAITLRRGLFGTKMTVSSAKGAAGWCPGEDDWSMAPTTYAHSSLEVLESDWAIAAEYLDEAEFWNLPVSDDDFDDSVFLHANGLVVESAERSRYFAITRGHAYARPAEAPLLALCAFLVGLADVQPAEVYSSCGLTPAV